tara:strand:- start:431856 stop:432542 length:687 start_codon:yes stop_codon:yes gene_type:complete
MVERPRYTTVEMLPTDLAVFPLPGALLLPGGQMPLNIFESRYLNMIEDALGHGRLIGMIQPFAEKDERQIPDGTALYEVGCVGRIIQFTETGDGRYVISLQGVCRFRVGKELTGVDGYRRIRPDYTPYLSDLEVKTLASDGTLEDRESLLAAMNRYFVLKGIEADIESIEGAPDGVLVTSLAMSCPFGPGEKQALLECANTLERGRLLISMFEFALHETGTPSSDMRQ